MRELTSIETELVARLVDYWRNVHSRLSDGFFHQLRALGSNSDTRSSFEVILAEALALQEPRDYRMRFHNAEEYRYSLHSRIVSGELAQSGNLPEEPGSTVRDVDPPEESPPTPTEWDISSGLAEYWNTGHKPEGLETHIARYSGSISAGSFFRNTIRRIDQHGRAAYSARLLDIADTQVGMRDYILHVAVEYVRATEARKAEVAAAEEKQRTEAAALEKAQQEARAIAHTEFEALGERIQAATSHEEAASLSRRRAELAPSTGRTFVYENHCWDCKGDISSEIHARCPTCGWYICSCGACGCQFERGHTWFGGS